jgi:hypothetical protein
MKTIRKQVQQIGRISLVQFETLEGEGMAFLPAAPAMEKGDLVVREVRQEGSVNTLLAINPTVNYYLLTDMDLLKGARQNRVVNRSILVAPRSKQEIEVSCVERSRWSYDSPTFKPGPEVMDTRMRAAKADSLRMEKEGSELHSRSAGSTQSKIWGLIRDEMVTHNFLSETEDYTSILDHKKEGSRTMQKFIFESECNGMALYDERKLISFDVFGNREVYEYYFDKLAGNALRHPGTPAKADLPGEAELFYRLDEFLDLFESRLKDGVQDGSARIGSLRWSGISENPGFELTCESQLVHMAGFSV